MKYIIVIFFLFLISCNPFSKTLDEKLDGAWAIEEMRYQNIPYKDSLSINTLFFDQGQLITLPPTLSQDKEETIYEMDEQLRTLNILSKNPLFKGKYEVTFVKNEERQLLGIELKSRDTYLLAYKFSQDYKYDGIGW